MLKLIINWTKTTSTASRFNFFFCLLIFLCYQIKYDGLSESVGFAQNWGIFQTRMDQRGDSMKMNFDYFQIQSWMLQKVWAEKVDEKNGVICPVSMFSLWVMVLKLSKKVHFCNFVLTLASNHDMVYRNLSNCLWDISN